MLKAGIAVAALAAVALTVPAGVKTAEAMPVAAPGAQEANLKQNVGRWGRFRGYRRFGGFRRYGGFRRHRFGGYRFKRRHRFHRRYYRPRFRFYYGYPYYYKKRYRYW